MVSVTRPNGEQAAASEKSPSNETYRSLPGQGRSWVARCEKNPVSPDAPTGQWTSWAAWIEVPRSSTENE